MEKLKFKPNSLQPDEPQTNWDNAIPADNVDLNVTENLPNINEMQDKKSQEVVEKLQKLTDADIEKINENDAALASLPTTPAEQAKEQELVTESKGLWAKTKSWLKGLFSSEKPMPNSMETRADQDMAQNIKASYSEAQAEDAFFNGEENAFSSLQEKGEIDYTRNLVEKLLKAEGITHPAQIWNKLGVRRTKRNLSESNSSFGYCPRLIETQVVEHRESAPLTARELKVIDAFNAVAAEAQPLYEAANQNINSALQDLTVSGIITETQTKKARSNEDSLYKLMGQLYGKESKNAARNEETKIRVEQIRSALQDLRELSTKYGDNGTAYQEAIAKLDNTTETNEIAQSIINGFTATPDKMPMNSNVAAELRASVETVPAVMEGETNEGENIPVGEVPAFAKGETAAETTPQPYKEGDVVVLKIQGKKRALKIAEIEGDNVYLVKYNTDLNKPIRREDRISGEYHFSDIIEKYKGDQKAA